MARAQQNVSSQTLHPKSKEIDHIANILKDLQEIQKKAVLATSQWNNTMAELEQLRSKFLSQEERKPSEKEEGMEQEKDMRKSSEQKRKKEQEKDMRIISLEQQVKELTLRNGIYRYSPKQRYHVTRINKYGSRDNTASESLSRTSSLHDSTDSPDRQIRDVRRRRGIRRRESIKLGTGRESIRRGTGRESSRRGTGRESGSRGRGRVTRQRRGRGNQGPSLSRTKVALTAEARDHQLKERIASMTKAEKDDILARICQKHPNLVFELIDGSSMEQQGYHPRPGGESPSWCSCNNCREMPTDEEKQCCKQIEANCFSRLPDFDLVVLDEVVLLVAQRYRQDVVATEEDDNYNRGKRHTAYRQFILWTFGYLGAGNRRVIPSCCVWRIRDKYPDSFDQYRGFIQGRLG